MVTDQDCFQRAARRFLAEVEAENRSAADEQVSEDGNKEKAGAVIELEAAGLDEDVTEEVGLLGFDGSGEDVVEMTQEEEEPEKEIITIKVDGEDRAVEAYRYPNGSARDIETGRFLAPPSPNTFEDPKKARAAITTRHERVLELAREGLVKGVRRSGDHDVRTPAEAWAAIVEEQTVLAMGDKRGSTASARLVGSATKMISEDKPQTVDVREGGTVVVVDFDGALLGMFNKLHPGDPQLALDEMKKYRNGLT